MRKIGYSVLGGHKLWSLSAGTSLVLILLATFPSYHFSALSGPREESSLICNLSYLFHQTLFEIHEYCDPFSLDPVF